MDVDTIASVNSQSLCTECVKLVPYLRPPLPTNRTLGEWTVAFLNDSAIVGCHLCRFISEWASRRSPRDDNFGSGRVYLALSSFKNEPGCRISLASDNDHHIPGSLVSTRPIPTDGLLPGAQISLIIPLTGRSQPDTVEWSRLRGWVSYCIDNHAHGVTADVRPWASTFRLIDVERECIVVGNLSWKYIALSYVWGRSKPVRLSSQNYKELSEPGGLARIALPKTFRDAISIAANLHWRYLWIDALCIQHDDEVDLTHQINGMDRIYREASVTIVSLTNNADCEIPGLRGGSRQRHVPFTCDIEGLGGLVYVRPSLDEALKDSTWETRGWTLQEKFFSRRLIFFTSHQVYYRCADATWAEDVAMEPEDFTTVASFSMAGRNEGLAQVRQESSAWARLHDFRQYQTLIQEYMRRRLTRDGDALAAVSGILGSFEATLGVSHFGLPRAIFDAALLWQGSPKAKRRPDFPSWSWSGWDLQGVGGEIKWLVVAETHDGADDPWTHANKNPGSERTLECFAIYFKLPVVISLPRLLVGDAATSAFPQTASNSILTFEASTFWSRDIVYIDRNADLAFSSFMRSRNWLDRRSLVFQLVVLSGSPHGDTWLKRWGGTSNLPGAPLWGESQDGSGRPRVSVNLMLIVRDDDRDDGRKRVHGGELWRRLWVFNPTVDYGQIKTKRQVIRLG
jgi:hypothetical protein